MMPRATGVVLLAATGVCLVFLGTGRAQQVHRNGFETRELSWVKGATDASFRELAHDLTDRTAHTGQSSEHIELNAEHGSFIYYTYAHPRAPIADELVLSLWVKANRPGMQILARVVLPHERNPNNLDEPVTALIRGDLYERVGRWQRMEIRRPVQLVQAQQQLMQFELKRALDIREAFVDHVVLNVYAGPGKTEVWIDDLEAGPVIDQTPFQPVSRAITRPNQTPTTPRAAAVEFRDGLMVNGKRFLFRCIRHTDTPLKALRDAGFNAVWLDYDASPALLEEAVNLGFWLVPALPVNANDPRLSTPEQLGQVASHFLNGDAVLFWDLGGGLVREQADRVAQAAQVVRAADPQAPLGVDAWDGFAPYARAVDLIGAHRWPLMTAMELDDYRLWLEQRRRLAPPKTFFWTWIQTHLPEWYSTLVYGSPGTAGFSEPIGPQPEQIRLLTYSALAAGCRGLAFWSDRFLADSHQGRDRLLELALLNQELQMLDPLITTAGPPRWISTSVQDVKAAVMRTDHGILVLPMWLGKGGQYVPGQAAAAKLMMNVPEVPAATQAWLVSPAQVRSLQTERVVGGTRVTIPEFGVTAAILFTADDSPTGLLVRFQDQVRRTRPLAAQWARSLAEAELEKVAKIETRLEQAGHTLPDGQALMDDARRRLGLVTEHWNNNNYEEAYGEAQRAVRPLRILMRAQWENATKELDSPVSSPYAVSFFTLPEHWRFMEEMRHAMPGKNLLPGGDFELPLDKMPQSWTPQQQTIDDVVCKISQSGYIPKEGKQCLLLEIKPKQPELRPQVIERSYLALNSPTLRLPPGTLVRISAWVHVPSQITGCADGALFFDSIGGEPLADRFNSTAIWKRVVHYRRVPASGTVSVTLALTGLGSARFDDVRIEPLLPNATAQQTPAAATAH
jgi:hypothetical protein